MFHRLLVTLLTVLLAGGSAVGQPEKKYVPVAATKELLDTLLKQFEEYELPFPPADAPLVRKVTGTRSYDKGTYTDYLGLGFLIKSKKAGVPDRVFWPVGRIDDVERKQIVTLVEPLPAALKGVTGFVDTELAILCHARGWTDLALKVLEQSQQNAICSPEKLLAMWAWRNWLLQFEQPETDRAKVACLLKVIADRRKDDSTPGDRRVLHGMTLSLVPGKGKPGTLEALVDELIDVNGTDQSDHFGGSNEPHPAYLILARRGFEAVPVLIEHLGDERLTRASKQGFNNFHGYNYMVGDVVSDLLQGLAGEELGKDWLRRLQGYRLEKVAVEKWWADAKKVGEEAYFVRHVLGDNTDGNLKNRLMLDVMAHKYPKQLPIVYRKMLSDRPEMFGWELGDAVENSPLPKVTKRELFLEATNGKGVEIRMDGLSRLVKIDRAKGLEVLLAELNRVPISPKRDNSWSRPEEKLAGLVIDLNEPAAWTALEKTAKRVSVGLRMQYLDQMTRGETSEATKKARLALLSKFLDDDSTVWRKLSEKYPGPYDGSEKLMMDVRNVVAVDLAEHLKMDVEPKPEWTEAEWAKLRADVQKKLAEKGIR